MHFLAALHFTDLRKSSSILEALYEEKEIRAQEQFCNSPRARAHGIQFERQEGKCKIYYYALEHCSSARQFFYAELSI